MAKLAIRKPYIVYENEPWKAKEGEESLTKQAMQEECDINNIMERYTKTGQISHFRTGGSYLELPDNIDFHESLLILEAGREAFMSLPAQLRREFDNDPEKFLEFTANPENVERMIELGMVDPPIVAANDQGEVDGPGGASNPTEAGAEGG